ncbi:AGL097Cp [Eremothecium gossypii ATCC 10895]|uniref:P-type Na(+) transporter n=1 Tax=Eremothecium gossypii (strain ATCC 10895 / CBS 109.51 / FGSC 9923 / NRRL Y-1056) TaxID=284811 RepID=Q750P4_EREGS|nr:AGL097Cp [Eremothecium gossypii ATCC 10895]AAS54394.2 AGL097Cp [Eremothecium gossypii ATCC 10895]AEY98721.1 FAGL097Cp [Eremothecium gossypii FDAG1]
MSKSQKVAISGGTDVYERTDFHALPAHEVARLLGTDLRRGLTAEEARARLEVVGDNTLGEEEGINVRAILLKQMCNAMILVLIISMVIALAIKDWISGGVIAFVVALNVSIGAYQEYNACKTMNSLKDLSTPSARVIRNGEDVVMASAQVVPGDIVQVRVGDTVPADLRLVEALNLETDEALLTGEALPVAKDPAAVFEQDTPVGDRLNLAFASSTVSKGRATGIVVRTGLRSEIGKIAESLQGKQSLISRDENKSGLQNTVLTVKASVGSFLGTNVGTPLHRKLAKLALILFAIAVLFALIVMATQKFIVNREVAIYAICVALSMIPSSLVVVLTITMSAGAKVMSTRNVIVRRLDSLEALGAVNDICSDKTGTLTQGKMILKQLWVPEFGTVVVNRSNVPFDPTVGDVSLIPRFSPWEYQHDEEEDVGIIANFKQRWQSNSLPKGLNPRKFESWLHTATLANIATVFKDSDSKEWRAHGDPTEIAIQVFATRMDHPHHALTTEQDEEDSDSSQQNDAARIYEHAAEFPFDSSIKRMSAVYINLRDKNTRHVFTKGAFERVLKCCTRWKLDPGTGVTHPLTEDDLEIIQKNVDTLSNEGLRVLAFATKTIPAEEAESLGERLTKDRDFVESDLIFQGLVGIYDPPRVETAGAVKKCHRAGINVHMLTGDFPGTAKAIAQEVGILPHNLYHYPKEVVDIMVMTATQFDSLTDEELDQLPVLPLVIARCAPQTKVRMIDALHRREKFCAMTGDGVNDSPSLKKANVGIAMGINGSDVAKDASDIVLSDDNFASILNAVEEGRRMSDNIQKFVLQLLAANVAQAIYLMLGLTFLDEDKLSVFPLSPVEVLWIIVVTSCLPAMGLGLEKAAPDIMEKPPNDSKAGIFTWEVIVDMIVYGLVMAVCCLGCFVSIIYKDGHGNLGTNCNVEYSDSCKSVFSGRAATFATMTWCALILAWEVIDMRRSFFAMKPETDTPYTQVFKDIWSNQFLFWSVIFGFTSVFPVVYIPVINTKVFLHIGIGYEWGIAFAFSLVFWLVAEFWKFAKRRYYRNKDRAINPESDLENRRLHDPFEKYSSTLSRATTNIGTFRVTANSEKDIT